MFEVKTAHTDVVQTQHQTDDESELEIALREWLDNLPAPGDSITFKVPEADDTEFTS